MFKVGDVVAIVSTKEELGCSAHPWNWYDMRRYLYLGKKGRIMRIWGDNTYELCFGCFSWEPHQLRMVE